MANNRFFKKKFFFVTFALLIVMYSLLIYGTNPLLTSASDFLNYYVGATLVKEGNGKLLYDPATNYLIQDRLLYLGTGRNINVYRSLPFVAVLFLPLTFFSPVNAFRVFTFINLVLALGLVAIFYRLFDRIKRYNLFLLLLPFIYLPFIDNFIMGQTSLFLAFFLLLVYKFLKSNKNFLAGIFSALFLIKTHYLIFIPFIFLLSNNKRKYLFGFLVLLALFLTISLSVVGINQILQYPKYISLTETEIYGSRSYYFFSFYSLLNNLAFVKISKSLAFLTNAGFYLSGLIMFFSKLGKLSLENLFISMTTLVVTLSVHVYSYDLCFLLVPLFILLNRLVGKRGVKIGLDFIVLSALLLLPGLGIIHKTFYSSIVLIPVALFYLDKKFFAKFFLKAKITAV